MHPAENNRPPVRRRLTPQQRRELERRRRQRKLKKTLTWLIPAAILAIAAAVIILVLTGKGGRTADVQVSAPIETQRIEAVETAEVLEAAPTAEPTPEPAAYVDNFNYDEAYLRALGGETTGPQLNTRDYSVVDPAKANRWPEISADALPIVSRGLNMTEKAVCITVDDCNQSENLRRIVQSAIDNNGKITIFPIGENLEKENVAAAVKWAWENGMEIENHTYSHIGFYHYDDEVMTSELWKQRCLLSRALGVNYQLHFFRPRGGDERRDQRMQAYCAQLGMYGIAYWSNSGTNGTVSKILSEIEPGSIILFHTKDDDMNLLVQLIPALAAQGWRMVTLNEMFGLPDNETSDLSTLDASAKPALQPFAITIPTLKKTTYARAAVIVQQRLIDLGWLEGTADGEFGANSYMATGFFQVASGITANGEADPATQAALFKDDAARATPEQLAEMKAKYKSAKK